MRHGRLAASETLSADGRVRLDMAMTEVLRYPLNTPLIIEGSAEGATRDVRFLRAADRARQVQDYLMPRYGLSPNHLGVMPLGNQAEGSPRAVNGMALAWQSGWIAACSRPPNSRRRIMGATGGRVDSQGRLDLADACNDFGKCCAALRFFRRPHAARQADNPAARLDRYLSNAEVRIIQECGANGGRDPAVLQ